MQITSKKKKTTEIEQSKLEQLRDKHVIRLLSRICEGLYYVNISIDKMFVSITDRFIVSFGTEIYIKIRPLVFVDNQKVKITCKESYFSFFAGVLDKLEDGADGTWGKQPGCNRRQQHCLPSTNPPTSPPPLHSWLQR